MLSISFTWDTLLLLKNLLSNKTRLWKRRKFIEVMPFILLCNKIVSLCWPYPFSVFLPVLPSLFSFSLCVCELSFPYWYKKNGICFTHDKLYAYTQIAYNEAQNNNVFGFRVGGKKPKTMNSLNCFCGYQKNICIYSIPNDVWRTYNRKMGRRC